MRKRGNGAGDFAAVAADAHQHGAQHHLAAILRGGAGAQFGTQRDTGQVPDADRGAPHGLYYQLAQIG